MTNCEKTNELLSGYLDDELTQGDYQRVDVHLRSCASCRQAVQEMTQLKGAVACSQAKSEIEDEQWEKIMNDLPTQASRGIGWLLFIAGAVTLVSFGIWEFAIDSEVPLHIKLSISALWFGVLLLFLSVLRQRVLSYKTDQYKNVRY